MPTILFDDLRHRDERKKMSSSKAEELRRDTLQPFQKNKAGNKEVNEEYVKVYGAKSLEKIDPEAEAYYLKKGL